MKIPDLQILPADHPPSPFSFPVLIGARDGKLIYGQLPEGLTLRAVGWLGHEITTSGDVPEECIDRLVDAYDSRLVVSDGSRGSHDCEICVDREEHHEAGSIGPVVRWRGRELHLYGHGHHLVRLGSTVYMCPVLILHYMLDHKYQPPAELVTAVVEGRFLTTDDMVPSSRTCDDRSGWRSSHEQSDDGS